MIDGIPAWVSLSSPVAATLAVFWLVFTGRLVTRASHNDVVRVLENANVQVTTDRNNWQSAAALANQTNAVVSKTNSDLIETAKFSTHVMSALQENAGGGAHVVPSTSQ
ncbi:hypothetical protein ASF72_10590 [Arthrobacter sp. Leaf141]|uniref:hypothetical protein n=1 Tax=Arthrobacter sp. Leaf141 TaxID=1736273 RepID=UPI0007149939|nr:hypothetical protein [Arthrobacter sp. Leaf141]KQR02473.1 hypothetical protein ASF72_10590 [Arthrobacter sp. Leaf141]